MNRKRSHRKIASFLTAVLIFVAITGSGCAAHHADHRDRDLNRLRNARIAAGVTAGLLVIGTLAWLYGRSASDAAKEQAANEAAAQTSGPNGY